MKFVRTEVLMDGPQGQPKIRCIEGARLSTAIPLDWRPTQFTGAQTMSSNRSTTQALSGTCVTLALGFLALGIGACGAKCAGFINDEHGLSAYAIKDTEGDPITLNLSMSDNICWDALVYQDNKLVYTCSGSGVDQGEPLVGSEPCVIPESIQHNRVQIVFVPCDGAEGPPELSFDGPPEDLDTFLDTDSTFLPTGRTRYGFVEADMTPDLEFSTVRSAFVQAFSQDEARAMFEAIQPGADILPTVEPGVRVVVTEGASSVTIESDLPSRFKAFRVLIDGQIYAQKGDGTYTTASSLGAGWTRMTAELPISFFAAGDPVVVAQQGAEEDGVTSVLVEF